MNIARCMLAALVVQLCASLAHSATRIDLNHGWEFRTEADEATQAKPGYPECVAMIVQIGDHLSKQFDVKG